MDVQWLAFLMTIWDLACGPATQIRPWLLEFFKTRNLILSETYEAYLQSEREWTKLQDIKRLVIQHRTT
jgi:hypothetical protein